MGDFIRRNPDGSIWLKRAPGTLNGMEGVLVRGSVTLSQGDIDYPFYDAYLKKLNGETEEADE